MQDFTDPFRGGSRIFRRGGGGLTTAREIGVYPLPRKAETINVCN